MFHWELRSRRNDQMLLSSRKGLAVEPVRVVVELPQESFKQLDRACLRQRIGVADYLRELALGELEPQQPAKPLSPPSPWGDFLSGGRLAGSA